MNFQKQKEMKVDLDQPAGKAIAIGMIFAGALMLIAIGFIFM